MDKGIRVITYSGGHGEVAQFFLRLEREATSLPSVTPALVWR